MQYNSHTAVIKEKLMGLEEFRVPAVIGMGTDVIFNCSIKLQGLASLVRKKILKPSFFECRYGIMRA
jgi:hypothetical protein